MAPPTAAVSLLDALPPLHQQEGAITRQLPQKLQRKSRSSTGSEDRQLFISKSKESNVFIHMHAHKHTHTHTHTHKRRPHPHFFCCCFVLQLY